MSALSRSGQGGLKALLPRLPFGTLREEFDSMLSRLGDWEGQCATQLMSPSVDIAESEGTIDVAMDIPGMKAENIDIQVTGTRLTISGERQEDKGDKGNGHSYHRIERHQGQFSRTVSLPCEVDETRVEATYQNGVLRIKLPKTEVAKSHKIRVVDKK